MWKTPLLGSVKGLCHRRRDAFLRQLNPSWYVAASDVQDYLLEMANGISWVPHPTQQGWTRFNLYAEDIKQGKRYVYEDDNGAIDYQRRAAIDYWAYCMPVRSLMRMIIRLIHQKTIRFESPKIFQRETSGQYSHTIRAPGPLSRIS